MARQHFYSRVPARMSIFNRTDGFDTFAYSKGLSQEFIEKELSAVYENKPTKEDSDLIRQGKLAPIYCQYTTKSGEFVQSCISFLPHDYTGERSAYLVHSLIPDMAEKKEILENNENASLNPAMFAKDTLEFDMISPTSSPCEDYPEVKYETVKAGDLQTLADSYDPTMMKQLIFAMINVVCGKCKGIYLSIPAPMATFSESSLNFLNLILQIFPYSVRSQMSFVTYTGDFTKFASFKIKCVPEDSPEIPVSKGATFRFGPKISLGVQDSDMTSNGQLIEFFYSLISNDSLRKEFLAYFDHAVKAMPELKNMSLKNITDMVFLFQGGCGKYDEKSLLPDDNRMYDIFCAYEKYRGAMKEDYRVRLCKCLWRYPQSYQPIPKTVFAKLNKIYSTEINATKRVIMNTVLELIHTDTMRDKLFGFIKSYYPDENAETQEVIVGDLCRVYYGGFLQTQIFNFFEQYFSDGSLKVKDQILEKLLLTIRTDSVQDKIIEFLVNNYSILVPEQKEKVFGTFYEMIPASDAVSVKVMRTIDRVMPDETEEMRSEVREKISSLVKADQRRSEPKLLSTIFGLGSGFCYDTVATLIVTKWSENKIFEDYLAVLSGLPLSERIKRVLGMIQDQKDMSDTVANKLIDTLSSDGANGSHRTDLFTLIESDRSVAVNPGGELGKKIQNEVIRPAIEGALRDAFNRKLKNDGISFVEEYAKDNPYIKSLDGYAAITAFVNMKNALISCDGKSAVENGIMLSGVTGASDCISNEIKENAALSDEKHDSARMIGLLLVSYLKSGTMSFSEIYQTLLSQIETRQAEANSEAVDTYSSELHVMECVFEAAGLFGTSGINDEAKEAITLESGEVALLISSFVRTYSKKGKAALIESLNGRCTDGITSKLNSIISHSKSDNGSIFSRLFGKK